MTPIAHDSLRRVLVLEMPDVVAHGATRQALALLKALYTHAAIPPPNVTPGTGPQPATALDGSTHTARHTLVALPSLSVSATPPYPCTHCHGGSPASRGSKTRHMKPLTTTITDHPVVMFPMCPRLATHPTRKARITPPRLQSLLVTSILVSCLFSSSSSSSSCLEVGEGREKGVIRARGSTEGMIRLATIPAYDELLACGRAAAYQTHFALFQFVSRFSISGTSLEF